MQVKHLMAAMERIAPRAHAEPWDNVGLLVGDPAEELSRLLLCIDYTGAVADEARDGGYEAVVAYHPLIFDGLKRVTSDGTASLVHDAIRRGISIYSPHTAWDVAEGGANDVLADAVGLKDRQPLKLGETKSRQFKLVVFVPEKELEKVSRALFDAGAGRIGKYSCCSFQSPGKGTFFGDEGTNPAVGQSGRLEENPEVRLETVVAIDKVQSVIKALADAHPYEEPAFDLNQLAAPPEGIGMGRFGVLGSPKRVGDLLAPLKRGLEISNVLVGGDEHRMVTRIAVCAGAGRSMLDDAIARHADLFVTGELPHHDVLRAIKSGMSVICTLHSNSERVSLKRLRSRLMEQLTGVDVVLSSTDRDPLLVR